jgi:predicted dehydrogenase
MTNWGAHHLDIAQWGLGMDESGPVSVQCNTVRFHPQGWYEVPSACRLTYKYANGTTVLLGQGEKDIRDGTTFEGEKGTIFVNRGKLESNPAEIVKTPLTASDVHLYVSKDHHQNWLECIKSRRLPIADAEIGHRSATVCHLGNIALRTKKTLTWDPAKEQIVGDAELAKWVSKPYRAPWSLPYAS